MKKAKALLCVLLALLLLMACFAPASAANLQGRSYVIKAPRAFSGYTVPDTLDKTLPWDEAIDALDTLYFTDAAQVNVSGLGIPATSENLQFIANLASVTPKLLHRVDAITYTTTTADGATVIYSFRYDNARQSAKNAEDRAACEDALYQLMYGVKDNAALSDFDKLLILHDRLAAWVAYDKENLDANTVPSDDYGVYNPLIFRTGVCQGYSMVYGWMLDLLGFENYYETSNRLHHGWNKVRLGSEWYYVDVTFDDPVIDVPGRVMHSNVLIPFSVFKTNHSNCDDYDQTLTDTAYVDSFDKVSKSEIVRIGDAYYYFDHTVHPAKLMKRTAGGETALLCAKTVVFANTTHESAASHGSNWVYTPKMTAAGSTVYYIDGKEAYSLDVSVPGAEPQEIFSLTDDNGILAAFAPKDGDSEETAARKEATRREFILQGIQFKDGDLCLTAFNDAQFDSGTVAAYTVKLDAVCVHAGKEIRRETAAATCTETGSRVCFCPDCRALWTEKTPAAHVFKTTVVAPTCLDGGYTLHACTLCRYGYSDSETAALGHLWDNGTVTKRPNCSTPGIVTYSCLREGCNETDVKELGRDPTNHVMNASVVAPTCTEDGYTSHLCTLCKYGYTDSRVPALGHAALDKNGDCTRCHRHVQDVENPAEAEGDPANEKPAEKLSFFQRIIQWFKELFAKLFGR